LKINGTPHEVDVDGDTPLLWVLRDVLGMTGTKFGCGQALCGACTVHLDGQAIRSCQTQVDKLSHTAVSWGTSWRLGNRHGDLTPARGSSGGFLRRLRRSSVTAPASATANSPQRARNKKGPH
jgi:hypothetical protein